MLTGGREGVLTGGREGLLTGGREGVLTGGREGMLHRWEGRGAHRWEGKGAHRWEGRDVAQGGGKGCSQLGGKGAHRWEGRAALFSPSLCLKAPDSPSFCLLFLCVQLLGRPYYSFLLPHCLTRTQACHLVLGIVGVGAVASLGGSGGLGARTAALLAGCVEEMKTKLQEKVGGKGGRQNGHYE